jgi:hypothetical protein
MARTDGNTDRGRRADLIVASLLVTALIARIVWLMGADVRALTFRTTDDSYYYFQTALNFTHGRGWTFDGLHPTNGFHPLWMAMLLPVFAAWGDDPLLALRMTGVLVALVAAATLWVGWKAFGALAGRRGAVIGLLLLLQPFALYALLNGLETGVLILSLLFLMWMTHRHGLLAPDAGTRRDLALGAMLGLTFLARLDSVFLVPALVAVVFVGALQDGGVRALGPAARKLVTVGVAFAVVGAPYLAWNQVTFGHLVPISGALKSTFPVVSFDVSRLRSFHTLYGIGQMAVATLGLGVLAWQLLREGAGPRWVGKGGAFGLCAMMWGASAIHLAYSILYVVFGANWWHHASYLPVTLAIASMMFALIDDALDRRAWVMAGGVVLSIALLAGGLVLEGRRRGDARVHWYEAATWARAQLPRDAVIAMTDCGFLGYFAGHPVVNLDGIISSYGFQVALRDHRLSQYLAAAKVTHIGCHVAHYVDGEQRVVVPARLYHQPGSAIIATPAAEVYSTEPFIDGSSPREWGPVRFVFWDIRKVRIVDDARELAVSGSATP